MNSAPLRMRRDLRTPFPVAHWPEGVTPAAFAQRDAAEIHALLELAYANGGGKVAPFAPWWEALRTDSEFDPSLCFLARSGDAIIGVAQCWTSAFVKDLAVHSDWQKRGVGTALLLQAFHALRARGADFADLKVEGDNPSGAVRFYESLGMRPIADRIV